MSIPFVDMGFAMENYKNIFDQNNEIGDAQCYYTLICFFNFH